jgi:type I restriction enzyme S subunit
MENLQPKLRFPEFEGEWEKKSFKEIFSFRSTNSFSRDKLNYNAGSVKNIHYGDIHTKFKTIFDIDKEIVPYINEDVSIERISEDNYLKVGDLVIADASEDYDDIGKCIEIINLEDNKVLAGLHTFIARPDIFKMAIGFNGYLMKSEKTKLQIKTIAQGSKVLSLSTTRLSDIVLDIPNKEEEQTRIANFLSLIDEKITLLKEKKADLQEYKKGIMQKIFSQEIRFKDDNEQEFEEWVEKTLGEIGDIVTGKTPDTTNLALWNGDIQFITPTDIKENNKYQIEVERFVAKTDKLKILPAKSIIFTCIASIGKMCMSIKPCITNQQINSLIPFDNYNNEFIYYSILFITPKIKSTQANTTLPIINKTEFSKFKISIPCLKEQTRIATFLSAIDEKIELVSNQIDDTLEYKKGLLQQMFV